MQSAIWVIFLTNLGFFCWLEGIEWANGLLRRPYGAWDRGCGLGWSTLSWVVFAGWLARGGILRFAQNDKGDRSGRRVDWYEGTLFLEGIGRFFASIWMAVTGGLRAVVCWRLSQGVRPMRMKIGNVTGFWSVSFPQAERSAASIRSTGSLPWASM
jgi:hypothetical protein